MNNVVSFPRHAVKPVKTVKAGKAMTLFLHVKKATMIVHLAAQTATSTQADQAAES